MCELGKWCLYNIVHHWHRVDRVSCKTDKLCWCYNGHSLPQNSLIDKSKGRIRYLLMQFVEVSYVCTGQDPLA